jgi:predicted phosphate transport protein (TIGR00153 family)
MAVFTRTTKNLIIKIDEFFDNIELGLLVFKEGIKAFLEKDMEAFERHLHKVDSLENGADKLQRSIENEMITHSILPQHRAEVVQLIEQLDEIIDGLKSTLYEFDIENPEIPEYLNKSIISLAVASVNAAEELIPATRAYFKAPHTVREKLLKVYYFESETDRLSFNLKKKIFHELNELDLAHKAHLRYIIHHIENISDLAQKAADLLSAMAIKIIM